MNNTTETLRIRCKQTGEVYNASENFTKKYEPIDLSTAEFKYECAANYTPDYQVPNGYFVINKTVETPIMVGLNSFHWIQ